MNKKPHFHGHRKRLRQRFLESPRQLADYEILELLLAQVVPRRDTKPLAKEMLERFSTFRGALQARPEELRSLEGFGPALEFHWSLLRECRARFHESESHRRIVLSSPTMAAEMAMNRLGGLAAEEFWVAMVDNKNRLLAWEQVSRGTVNQAPVYPREVLAMALRFKASGMILVHNHPGGDVSPSQMDRELTERIARASKELDVRLLDHLIVTEDDFFSFQKTGLI